MRTISNTIIYYKLKTHIHSDNNSKWTSKWSITQQRPTNLFTEPLSHFQSIEKIKGIWFTCVAIVVLLFEEASCVFNDHHLAKSEKNPNNQRSHINSSRSLNKYKRLNQQTDNNTKKIQNKLEQAQSKTNLRHAWRIHN